MAVTTVINHISILFMIKESNNPLLRQIIYNTIVKLPTRNMFHRVWVRQNPNLPKIGALPILLYANHTSWWDGYMISVLMHELWRPAMSSLMVEAETLQKYSFLRYLGAFGVDRENPRDGIAAIQHAVTKLNGQPYGVVAIFPQGKFYHPEARPLHFYNGVGLIAKQAVTTTGACALVPLALRYEFVHEQKPEAFLHIGTPTFINNAHPIHNNAKALTAHMEQTLIAEMDILRADCVAYRFDSFSSLLSGNMGIQQWWDTVRPQAFND